MRVEMKVVVELDDDADLGEARQQIVRNLCDRRRMAGKIRRITVIDRERTHTQLFLERA